jgi:hypothetical protein
MRAYRDLSTEDKASAFKYLLKEMPREHMLAQLSLLGMPDDNREELSKEYEEHLKALKETNEEWAQEAAIVAKTLLTLHSVARKKEGFDEEGNEIEKEDKLPPLWKRVIIIPACFLLVGFGLLLKNYIEDTWVFGAVMAVIIFGCGGYLMKFLGEDDEEDMAKIDDLIQKEMLRRELANQDDEGAEDVPEPKKDK